MYKMTIVIFIKPIPYQWMNYYCYYLNNSMRWDTYHHSYRSDISLCCRDISKYMIMNWRDQEKKREKESEKEKKRMKREHAEYINNVLWTIVKMCHFLSFTHLNSLLQVYPIFCNLKQYIYAHISSL
jgi:hypothetical protein